MDNCVFSNYAVEFESNLAPISDIRIIRLTCLDNNKIKFAGDHEIKNTLFEDLRIKDVRTDNKKADGSLATNNAGWFKVDHFRLELKEAHYDSGLDRIEENLFKVVSLDGQSKHGKILIR
jgi:hypothetical protein